MSDLITYEELRQKLYYDPKNGLFTRFRGKRKVGSVSRYGYLIVGVKSNGKRGFYMAHRLAWFYVYGRWPKSELDHVNNNRLDNRISNLREADRQQNAANMLSKNEVRGVRRDQKRWLARIKVNYRTYNLGRFKTKIEAAAAYNRAARLAFGEFAKLNG